MATLKDDKVLTLIQVVGWKLSQLEMLFRPGNGAGGDRNYILGFSSQGQSMSRCEEVRT